MSSDDYQVRDTYKYSRKSYKKNLRQIHVHETDSPRIHRNIDVSEISPRSGDRTEDCSNDVPGCSCDIDPDAEIANILHKKCPVITLAQQQLQRVLDETDKLLCENTRCCRSVYDCLCICKDIFMKQNNCWCVLVVVTVFMLITGLLIGAATCGSYLGKFNSPILNCIDSHFIPGSYTTIKDTYLSIT
ncbi:hypothetical protein evm_013509 [Chilo suppressalis]|nr:hypothetical protein evm_013509 [Chilo suppressalis]